MDFSKAAPWRSSRYVHLSAGIAIGKNLGGCGLRQAALLLLMSASTHIDFSGLWIHILCNSEQVSMDGFLFWHRGCSSPAQLYSQSWFKKFPPWIPHSSLLVPGSALQFLVPSAGRQTYKPHCTPATAAILPTDSVSSKGLPTAAVWLMATLPVQAKYNCCCQEDILPFPLPCAHTWPLRSQFGRLNWEKNSQERGVRSQG